MSLGGVCPGGFCPRTFSVPYGHKAAMLFMMRPQELNLTRFAYVALIFFLSLWHGILSFWIMYTFVHSVIIISKVKTELIKTHF